VLAATFPQITKLNASDQTARFGADVLISDFDPGDLPAFFGFDLPLLMAGSRFVVDSLRYAGMSASTWPTNN